MRELINLRSDSNHKKPIDFIDDFRENKLINSLNVKVAII